MCKKLVDAYSKYIDRYHAFTYPVDADEDSVVGDDEDVAFATTLVCLQP